VWKPRAIGGRDVPDPRHVVPADRLPRPLRVLAGHLVRRDQQPVAAGDVSLGKPGLDGGDQEAQTEESRDEPAESIAIDDHPHTTGREEDRPEHWEYLHQESTAIAANPSARPTASATRYVTL